MCWECCEDVGRSGGVFIEQSGGSTDNTGSGVECTLRRPQSCSAWVRAIGVGCPGGEGLFELREFVQVTVMTGAWLRTGDGRHEGLVFWRDFRNRWYVRIQSHQVEERIGMLLRYARRHFRDGTPCIIFGYDRSQRRDPSQPRSNSLRCFPQTHASLASSFIP